MRAIPAGKLRLGPVRVRFRSSRRRWTALVVLAALALCATFVLFVVFTMNEPGRPYPTPPIDAVPGTVATPATAVRQIGTASTGNLDGKQQEQLSVPVAASPIDRGPFPLDPPYDILDALTFANVTGRFHLTGLDGPSTGAVCFDKDGALWACGLQGRAALNNTIRKQRLECRRAGEDGPRALSVTCRVDGRDLGRLVVDQGFARPTDASDPDAVTSSKAAQVASRGLWNGSWNVRR